MNDEMLFNSVLGSEALTTSLAFEFLLLSIEWGEILNEHLGSPN